MARRFFNTLLVGIEVPHQRSQPALQRAAQIARHAGARLTLFHAAFSPYAVGPNFYRSTLEQGVAKTLAERRAALEKLAAPLRKRGLKVTVKAVWDDPPYEAIVREALHSKPDLVVAESRRRSFGARVFLSNTDWQLIRLCPAPLLFVKQTKAYGKARVLAAIDPLHAHAKPARLDRRILEVAGAIADAHAGRLDVAHVWVPPSILTATTLAEPMAVYVDPKLDEAQERYVRRALERFVAPLGLPPGRLHLESGFAESVLPALARRLHTDILVMGAVSRRGLKRLFIGNTAERTIDDTACDLLVVKPRGFRTPVSRTATPVQLQPPSI